jgi:hypothetical protein
MRIPTGKKNSGTIRSKKTGNEAFVTAQTFKTHFQVTTLCKTAF